MVMFLAINKRHRTDLYWLFEAATANSCEVKGVATMLPTFWLVLSVLIQLPAGTCGLYTQTLHDSLFQVYDGYGRDPILLRRLRPAAEAFLCTIIPCRVHAPNTITATSAPTADATLGRSIAKMLAELGVGGGVVDVPGVGLGAIAVAAVA